MTLKVGIHSFPA